MKILKRVPKSVLWLHQSNNLAVKNLKAQALAHDIDPDRIIFSKKVSFDEHMNRLALSDLALDTRIYSGGATASHTLWVGIPVLALKGKHYLSRMCTSILKTIGLPELITHSLKEYENLAIDLALHPKKCMILKPRLKSV